MGTDSLLHAAYITVASYLLHIGNASATANTYFGCSRLAKVRLCQQHLKYTDLLLTAQFAKSTSALCVRRVWQQHPTSVSWLPVQAIVKAAFIQHALLWLVKTTLNATHALQVSWRSRNSTFSFQMLYCLWGRWKWLYIVLCVSIKYQCCNNIKYK